MYILIPFIFLLPLLAGCNPEHNPKDLRQITSLKTQLKDAQDDLTEERTVEAEDATEAEHHQRLVSALYVIADAYVNLAKPEDDGMTVCFGSSQGAGWIRQTSDDLKNCVTWVSFELGHDETTGHIEFDPNGD